MVMQYGLLRGESARNDGTLIFRVLIGAHFSLMSPFSIIEFQPIV